MNDLQSTHVVPSSCNNSCNLCPVVTGMFASCRQQQYIHNDICLIHEGLHQELLWGTQQCCHGWSGGQQIMCLNSSKKLGQNNAQGKSVPQACNMANSACQEVHTLAGNCRMPASLSNTYLLHSRQMLACPHSRKANSKLSPLCTSTILGKAANFDRHDTTAAAAAAAAAGEAGTACSAQAGTTANSILHQADSTVAAA